jgi:hypothetical protein
MHWIRVVPIFVPGTSDFSSRLGFQRMVIFPVIFPTPVQILRSSLVLKIFRFWARAPVESLLV